MKPYIIYSKNVKEPTLVLVIPEENSFELKKEIEDFFIAGSTDNSIHNNLPETNKPAFERRAFTSKEMKIQPSDVREYIEENGLKFDGKDFVTKDGTEDDWFSFFSKMVRESDLKLIENYKFVNAIQDTLFSSLLGYSIAIGGYMKEPADAMVGIYYQSRGLVWISYPDKTMKVILRKGIYDEVDKWHKVIYSEKMKGVQDAIEEGLILASQVKSSTFGNYPFYLAENLEYDPLDDPDFIRDLIKKATEL